MKDTFVLDVDGEEVTCEVILGFTDDATGKEYIIYTDNSSDEDTSPMQLRSLSVRSWAKTVLTQPENTENACLGSQLLSA